MPEAFKPASIVRTRGTSRTADLDQVAVEEPLEVRLHNRTFATIMRTPGADMALAAGFLLSERVIGEAGELGAIEYCRDAREEARGNVVNVTLAGDAVGRLEQVLAERRNVTTNASCGMCGRQSIDAVTAGLAPLSSASRVGAAMVQALPDRLRAVQRAFDASGGLHAAGVFSPDGQLTASAEDVGRHNAVDKVVGTLMMRDELPLSDAVLFVSGRTSFEIVQKAFVAGIPIVAAVSAPSSLAIDLAAQAGITLIGFVRDATFNIYAHQHRVS
jgi:FdhD protein